MFTTNVYKPNKCYLQYLDRLDKKDIERVQNTRTYESVRYAKSAPRVQCQIKVWQKAKTGEHAKYIAKELGHVTHVKQAKICKTGNLL